MTIITSATIARVTDVPWRTIPLTIHDRPIAVDSVKEGLLIVTQDGIRYRRGDTLEPITTNLPHTTATDAVRFGGTVIVTSAAGGVFTTSNDGLSWNTLPKTPRPLRSVAAGTSVWLAVDDRGRLLRSDDEGRSWATVEGIHDVQALRALDDERCAVLVRTGLLVGTMAGLTANDTTDVWPATDDALMDSWGTTVVVAVGNRLTSYDATDDDRPEPVPLATMDGDEWRTLAALAVGPKDVAVANRTTTVAMIDRSGGEPRMTEADAVRPGRVAHLAWHGSCLVAGLTGGQFTVVVRNDSTGRWRRAGWVHDHAEDPSVLRLVRLGNTVAVVARDQGLWRLTADGRYVTPMTDGLQTAVPTELHRMDGALVVMGLRGGPYVVDATTLDVTWCGAGLPYVPGTTCAAYGDTLVTYLLEGASMQSTDRGRTWTSLRCDDSIGVVTRLVRLDGMLYALGSTSLARLQDGQWRRWQVPVPTVGAIAMIGNDDRPVVVTPRASFRMEAPGTWKELHERSGMPVDRVTTACMTGGIYVLGGKDGLRISRDGADWASMAIGGGATSTTIVGCHDRTVYLVTEQGRLMAVTLTDALVASILGQ